MSDFFDRLGAELERAIATDMARQRRSYPNLAVAVGAAVFVLVTIGATLLVVRPFSGDELFAPVTQTAEIPIEPGSPPSNAVNEVRAVAAAADGSLWAATGGGIVHWDVATKTPTVYTTEDGLPTNGVYRIAIAPDGVIWAGGSGWVARFDGTWHVFAAPAGLDGPAWAIDPDGVLWGVGGENELYRFDGAEWQVTEVPGLSGVGEWSGSLDAAPDGTIWAATNMARGLLSFDGERWSNHTGDLPDGFALNVSVAPEGTVWAGAEGDARGNAPGVARFDGTDWTVYSTVDGLFDDSALLAVGSDGTVWATHSDEGVRGVSRFDGERWTAFPGVGGAGWGLAVDPSGTLWMPADDGLIGFDGEESIRLAVSVGEPPATTTTAPAEGWNSVLAETDAKPLPEVATCPAGMNPSRPGPTGQERPAPGYVRNDAAAFDSRRGRVIYADALGATWAFDVCANTWVELEPAGVLTGDAFGGLVYDADSDRVIALGEQISVYNPTSNAWSQVSPAGVDLLDFWPVGGAVWDPVSGLVVVQHMGVFKAYDVETNTWTTVGTLPEDPGALLGYSQQLDRFIFAGGFFGRTLLVDPRTGTTTELEAETPPVVGGFGSALYTPGSDGAYVAVREILERGVCWFDGSVLDWECSQSFPVEGAWAPNALEHDPINHRLLAIGAGGWGYEDSSNAVWALDLGTGKWTEVVEATVP